MFKKISTKVKNFLRSERAMALAVMLIAGTAAVFAQSGAGDYASGTKALGDVTKEIAKYVPVVVKLCYAIAGVVAVVGSISVYVKINYEIFVTLALSV